MIEKGKISSLQMMLLLYPTLIITAYLISPSDTSELAHHDMWFSPIIGSLSAFIAFAIMYKIYQYYPGKTFIEILDALLGKVMGKTFSIMYIIFLVFISAEVIREYEEAIVTVILPRTPVIIIDIAFFIVSTYAVKGGIEVIGRLANLFVPLIFLLLVMMVGLTLKDFDPGYIFPMFHEGIKPSAIGALTTQGILSESAIAAMFFPYLTDQNKAFKLGMFSIFLVMVSLVLFNLTVTFLFGNVLEDYSLPIVNIGRYIMIADFFEHLESVVISIWILGAFLKIAVFHYVSSLSIAQTFKLKSYRPLVIPIGVIIVLFSFWNINTYQELVYQIRLFSVTFFPVMFIILPFLFLIFAIFKNKGGKGVEKAG